MKLKNKDVITLNNDDQYLVISTAVFEKENYVYIVNQRTMKNSKLQKFKKTNSPKFPMIKNLLKS